jgi:hypothetical protein
MTRERSFYAGAEYAGGKRAATVFHFPKWLFPEAFVLQYYPQSGNFSCMPLNGENTAIGVGNPQAAKRSVRARIKPSAVNAKPARRGRLKLSQQHEHKLSRENFRCLLLQTLTKIQLLTLRHRASDSPKIAPAVFRF